MYIDDIFVMAPDFSTQSRVKQIMDELTAQVGNEFKDINEIGPLWTNQFLGILGHPSNDGKRVTG